MTRMYVDGWDPSFGTGLDPEGPQRESSAKVATDVELPAGAWRPIAPPAAVKAPGTVRLVDGVRRIDARVWLTDDEDETHPGIAASYAAGVVRCDLRRGAADVVTSRIARGLFTPCQTADEVIAGAIRYPVRYVGRGEPTDLVLGVQRQLLDLEATVASAARDPEVSDDEDLLVVDGPLKGRAHLPRALGYVKTHRVEYLPRELSKVVTTLQGGERCPVFLLGTSWHRYAWYLRLPGPAGSPWAGIVRAECSAELTVEAAIALAHLSAVTLPRFASHAYKDPRAPQNLVPIAGLERRLRTMLGDARLLHRALTGAARRTLVST